MIVFAWILVFSSLVTANNATANAQTYIDSTHQFRVKVPEGWGSAPLEGRIVWHIASEGGSEMPDCGLIVTAHKSFSQITSDQYIQSQSEAQLTKVLGLSFSDVTIGVWEPDFEFAGQRALHFIYTGVLDGSQQTSMGMQTIRNGKLYSFFCNAVADDFPKIYVNLLATADSFSFLTSRVSSDASKLTTSNLSTFLQWALIVFLFSFVPYTYWRITKYGSAPIALKAFSFLGTIVVGGMAAVALLALKVIGVPSFLIVILLFCVAHFYGLRLISNRAKRGV